MADSTIAQLPSALSLTGAEYFPVDQSGVTKKATLSMLAIGSVYITSGKALYVTNTLTFTGTDGTTITFPSTSATMARTDAAQTFTGLQTFTNGLTTPAQYISTIATGTAPFVVASTTPVANLSIGGNAGTASTLETARTIDGVSFDGSANITVIAPATHAATNKATPVDADEFSIWDSVSGLLNHVTWANLKTTLGATFAALAGSASQVFSIAFPTVYYNAARLEQVALFPSIISSASPDIFGAYGYSINYNNSTPVVMTSITACRTSQIGSVKKLIPSADTTVTASANLVVDGADSGNFILPADADIEIRSETTTKFIITTVYAYGTWTPAASYSGSNGDLSNPTQVGLWTKVGRTVHKQFFLSFAETTASGNLSITGLKFTANSTSNMYVRFALVVDAMTGLSGGTIGQISPSGTTIEVYYSGTGNIANVTEANTDNPSNISGEFSYDV